MRDTTVLRARLQGALTGALTGALGLGCTSSPPQPTQDAPVAARSEPGRLVTDKRSEPEASSDAATAPTPSSSYPNRWGRDPYDPESEEEQGCTNGDWCGTPAQARKFASQTGGEELGCPLRLVHVAESGVRPTDKAYVGFSFDPMMQGRLRPMATGEARAEQKSDDLCCYHWFNYCSGRPRLAGDALTGPELGAASVAAIAEGGAWVATREPVAGALDLTSTERADLAAAWLSDALLEHASIASFARATLELLALGAPPELIAGTQRASLDEVEHARLCFGLAAGYGGQARGPGALAGLAPRGLDLAGLAALTFVEGCVGETIAALVAMRAARSCRDPEVAAILRRIADDEARHAELAWATVAWAIEGGGAAAREAVSRAADRLRAAAEPSDGALSAEGLGDALLAAHGRLGPAALADAREDGWREIIGPMLATLLG